MRWCQEGLASGRERKKEKRGLEMEKKQRLTSALGMSQVGAARNLELVGGFDKRVGSHKLLEFLPGKKLSERPVLVLFFCVWVCFFVWITARSALVKPPV